MDSSTLSRARWFQNSDMSWLLKLPCRDGSTILAQVRFEHGVYVWNVGGMFDWHPGKRAAMRDARAQAWLSFGGQYAPRHLQA